MAPELWTLWPLHPIIPGFEIAFIALIICHDALSVAHRFPDSTAILSVELDEAARSAGFALPRPRHIDKLADFLKLASQAGCRVVVLIDEYDKPILDHLEDTPLAIQMRETLKGFYTVIKACDEYLRFVLLTGGTKFARVSVFSGLNNLQDITLDERYATLLGYTQAELETYFADRLDPLAAKLGLSRPDCLELIRVWYNGYRFHPAADKVYNPFSALLVFEKSEVDNYWFETGTPAFLLRVLRKANLSPDEINGLRMQMEDFSSFEVEHLPPYPLLFQTGYLTITDYDRASRAYRLDYPNQEVRQSFLRALARDYIGQPVTDQGHLDQLTAALEAGDVAGSIEALKRFFAAIPDDVTIKQEKYYQSVFYLLLTLLGMRIGVEVRTNRGRGDAVVQTKTMVYVFEFKLDGTAAEALRQIDCNDYTRPTIVDQTDGSWKEKSLTF